MASDLDLEWQNFAKHFSQGIPTPIEYDAIPPPSTEGGREEEEHQEPPLTPEEIRSKISPLSISTQSTIFRLNAKTIDTEELFWSLPMIGYEDQSVGVTKKQIRINMKSPEEVTAYLAKRDALPYPYTEQIVSQMTNPNMNARKNKFKDNRILSVGLTTKNFINCNTKQKKAFINCFTINLRIRLTNGRYNEYHVKIFKTMNITTPGIKPGTEGTTSECVVSLLKSTLLTLLVPFIRPDVSLGCGDQLGFMSEQSMPLKKNLVKNKKGVVESNLNEAGEVDEINVNTRKGCHVEYSKHQTNILINSNFECGFYLNQTAFADILHHKYGLDATYNKLNYPGIKCKYYIDNAKPLEVEYQPGTILPEHRDLEPLAHASKYTTVTFIPFRTGRSLILGAFSEKVLWFVFHQIIVPMIVREYPLIHNPKGVIIRKPKPTIKYRRIVVTPQLGTTPGVEEPTGKELNGAIDPDQSRFQRDEWSDSEMDYKYDRDFDMSYDEVLLAERYGHLKCTCSDDDDDNDATSYYSVASQYNSDTDEYTPNCLRCTICNKYPRLIDAAPHDPDLDTTPPLYKDCVNVGDFRYDGLHLYAPKNLLDKELFASLVTIVKKINNPDLTVATGIRRACLGGEQWFVGLLSVHDRYKSSLQRCGVCTRRLPGDLEYYTTTRSNKVYNVCPVCAGTNDVSGCVTTQLVTGLGNLSDWVLLFRYKVDEVYYCNLNPSSPHYKRYAINEYTDMIGFEFSLLPVQSINHLLAAIPGSTTILVT